jgi:hypothetical protein
LPNSKPSENPPSERRMDENMKFEFYLAVWMLMPLFPFLPITGIRDWAIWFYGGFVIISYWVVAYYYFTRKEAKK